MKHLRRCSTGVLVVLALLIVSFAVQAQVTTRILSGGNAGLNQFGAYGPQGPSISRSELPRLDVAQLRAEDEQYRKTGRPLRVAVQQNISLDILKAGTTMERNGYRIYQYEVLAPEAGGLSAIFDRLQLAENARVFLYNAEQTVLIGPITSQQNTTNAPFTSGHVTGDRLIIELQEPLSVVGQSQLHLLGVANFYEPRGPFGGLRPAGSCENNQVCFPTYQSEADGVALILVNDGAGGLYLCTGTTVNDARQSFRSFFLTAFHCTDFNENQINDPNEASSTAGWTFYFKYQSATCTPTTDNNTYVTLNGATYRAGSAASDFTLIELNAQAPQSESISFVGWDRSSNLASTVFGIHHPNGSLKKISFGGATSTVGVSYLPGGNYNVVSGTSFLQLSWNNGVTEGGSSGSALFDGTSRRVIGQLLGGSSFCSSPTAPDQYGRFFTSWTGGGANNNRLSNWLDPTGISGNTTNLAVPTVSGPAAFTNTGSFSLNTGTSSITSWSIVGANAASFSVSSGSGNVANLIATASASNVVIRFTVDAGQSYPIQFTKTFNATVAAPVNTAPTVANPVSPQSATVGVAYTLSLASVFTDAETPSSLTLSVMGLPAGLSFSPPATISGTPSLSGVSSVTVKATDPGSLSASTSFNITVSPAPVVVTSLSLVVSANPTTILTSGTTTLSATVSGGTTPYSYTFSGPGTITPSGTPASVSNLPAGVQSFTVLARDATSPTSQSISGTVSVTVNMAPPVNTAPTVANPVSPQSATVGVAYTLSLANVFTDAETPSSLTLSVSGLPAGLSFTAPSTISGTPSLSGVSSVTVVATDPGSLSASTSFTLTVSPAGGTPPPTGVFSITSVTTISCQVLSAGQRRVSFTPQYAGVNGAPISFSVVSEMLPTTSPGPYTLNLYTDNPVITLQAVQSGAPSSFAYNWLAVCSSTTANTPPTVANPVSPQSATVGLGYTLSLANVFTDAETPSSLSLSVSGLPAGLNFVAPSTISGTPSMSGVSNVTVTATDPGSLSASTSFNITVSPAAGTPPPPTGTFSITSVQTINCEVLSVGQRRLTFTPQYAGLNGAPVSFSVVSELLPTTAPGPYSLNLYTDNPVITLQAVQSGISSSFAYNWLAVCSSTTANTPPTVANPVSPQSATVGVAYTLSLANVFTDAETPNQLTLSVSGLPAGLSFSAPSTISGTPSLSGVSSVTVVATDPGSLSASTSFNITVSPAGGTPPTGTFSITGVTTISCQVLSAGQRRVSFTPQYAGLNGSPVSFSVVNELLPTTAPGPYSLDLYTDNPVITLRAVQSGVSTSFSYGWLAACSPSARVGAGSELTSKLKATILPNPVSEEFRIRLEGAQGQAVRLELSDVSGHSVLNRSVDVSSDDQQESVRFSQPGRGLYLLRVSTGQQSLTLKVIRE